jgi:hypothetical protein
MRSFKNVDTLQVIGLFLSVAIAILTWVMTGAKDPIPSILLGFVLAILTQGLDLQKRLNDAESIPCARRKLWTELCLYLKKSQLLYRPS